jgi:hypothetical protein
MRSLWLQVQNKSSYSYRNIIEESEEYLHMSQFVSDCERRTQSIVLNYGTTWVIVAHFA